jgi:hypothetical protein
MHLRTRPTVQHAVQKFRMQLGPDVRGRKHGITRRQAFAQTYMIFIPPIVLMVVARCMLRGWPAVLCPFALVVPCALPLSTSHVVPVLAGYTSLFASLAAAVFLIPSAVRSWVSHGTCVLWLVV